MEEKYSEPKFDFAKHICKKCKFDPLAVLSAIDLYSKCFIDAQALLEILQWLPEDARVTIWKAYKNINAKCD